MWATVLMYHISFKNFYFIKMKQKKTKFIPRTYVSGSYFPGNGVFPVRLSIFMVPNYTKEPNY